METQDSRAEPCPLHSAPNSASPQGQANSQAGKYPCRDRHAVGPLAQLGRACWYRNAELTLPADLQVPTCRRFKHMLLSFDSVPELASVLEATYRAELVQHAAVEIVPLSRAVSLLALLSAEPTRLEELPLYWTLLAANRTGAGKARPNA